MCKTYQYEKKLCNLYDLQEYINQIRKNKGIIVFTCGCFDIIHRGHIHYLRASRLLGDCLVIGLNSDKSVRKLKGKDRPVNIATDRVAILEAFDFVERIVVFDEDTPLNLIQKINPDIFTKGGDYDTSNLLGKGLGKEIIEDYGGRIEIIPSVEGTSTTDIINKVQKESNHFL